MNQSSCPTTWFGSDQSFIVEFRSLGAPNTDGEGNQVRLLLHLDEAIALCLGLPGSAYSSSKRGDIGLALLSTSQLKSFELPGTVVTPIDYPNQHIYFPLNRSHRGGSRSGVEERQPSQSPSLLPSSALYRG